MSEVLREVVYVSFFTPIRLALPLTAYKIAHFNTVSDLKGAFRTSLLILVDFNSLFSTTFTNF